MMSEEYAGTPNDRGGACQDRAGWHPFDAGQTPALELRLEEIARARAARPRASLFQNLIGLHSFIARQRAAGRGWEDLNAILEEGGIATDTATLRSYWAQIRAALHRLQEKGVHAPSQAQVLEAVREPWRKRAPVRDASRLNVRALRQSRPMSSIGPRATTLADPNDM